MRILILDDSKERHKIFRSNLIGNEVVKHCYTYDEFCDIVIAYDKFDVIFLDHDLCLDGEYISVDENGKELTGYEAARFLSKLPDKYPDKVVVHSYNPIGALNIERQLKMYDIKCIRIPFSKDIGI